LEIDCFQPYKMTEVSLITARAAVYTFEQNSKQWATADGGLSQISLYQNKSNNFYRIVAISLKNNSQVVINTPVHKNLKYTKASEVFGQFQDAKNTYGLNFASKPESDQFFNLVTSTVNDLNNEVSQPTPSEEEIIEEAPQPPAPQPPVVPQSPVALQSPAAPQKSFPVKAPFKAPTAKKTGNTKEDMLANFKDELLGDITKEFASAREEILAAVQERLQ